MPIRLQELHAAAVHMPIALIPFSLATDALGRVGRSRTLMEMGRLTMPVAAASAAVSGVLGLIAQETVRVDERTGAMLATHRNLNLGLLGLTAVMAARRVTRRRPSRAYLAAGAAGIAAMMYSAYLGGRMVYEYGLAVKPAGGLDESQAPELAFGSVAPALRVAADHVRSGARHAAQGIAAGELLPALRGPSGGAPAGRGRIE